MLTKTNLEEIADLFVELWDKGDPNLADKLFLAGFIGHDPVPDKGLIEVFKQVLAYL